MRRRAYDSIANNHLPYFPSLLFLYGLNGFKKKMRARLLTQEQIQQARELREQGLSKRELAREFGVSSTTIWDNVFTDVPSWLRKQQQNRSMRYVRLRCAVFAVQLLRIQGAENTQLVAHSLQMPLEEVNHIWASLFRYEEER